MKLQLLSLLFLVSPYLSKAQKSDLQSSQFLVTRSDLKVVPTLADYPYLAVSVLFRNEDKLADKNFLGKLNKMEFFFSEVSVAYNGQTETAPLYFLKK